MRNIYTGGGVYLDDRVSGSCRPAIFNLAVVQFFRKKLAVVQFFRKKLAVVQFQTRFFLYMKMPKTGDVLK